MLTRDHYLDTWKPHVLVAEDDDRMRALIAGTLRRDGLVVSEASNGAELLFWVGELLTAPEAVHIDLIIADIRMPAASGLEALERLRDDDWAMPMILMTAFGDDETHDEARRLGASTVFDKPFELDDLRTAVHYFAGGSR
jgi:CheY-like chemotaxis protein